MTARIGRTQEGGRGDCSRCPPPSLPPPTLRPSRLMRRLRYLLPAIATACVLVIAPTAADAAVATSAAARACPGANLTPTVAHAAQARRATLCLVNRQRARHGLRHLRLHRSLNHAATKYARLMVTKHFFDHVSPAGSTMPQRIKR